MTASTRAEIIVIRSSGGATFRYRYGGGHSFPELGTSVASIAAIAVALGLRSTVGVP
jgi:hypothetical protein